MNKKQFAIGARLFFGGLVFVALGAQFIRLHQQGVLNVPNFFSYFTNISNIIAGLVFVVSASYLLTNRKPTATGDVVRGAAVLYMAITGIVFSVLLRDQDLGALMPWVNTVIHYIMPVVVVLDWLYMPPRTKLTVRHAVLWLGMPLLYLAYSLIRGPIVHWYPYPFLNPEKAGGYAGVTLYCLGILIAFFAVAWLVMTLGNKLRRAR